MRDRLIELIASKVCDKYEKDQCTSKWNGCCGECLHERNFEIGDLADHLLANGVAVRKEQTTTEQEWNEVLAAVEEMAQFLWGRSIQNDKGWIYVLRSIALDLYNAGYRKQVEGEWVKDEKVCSSPFCSLCGAIGGEGNYCHYCGAKMSGGAK